MQMKGTIDKPCMAEGEPPHSCGPAWRSQGCAWPFVGCFLGVKTPFSNKPVKEGAGSGGHFRIFCLCVS